MKFKRNLVKEKPKSIIEKNVSRPLSPLLDKPFKTTDRSIVLKLAGMGIQAKEILSPSGERVNNLYVFSETEQQIEGKLHG